MDTPRKNTSMRRARIIIVTVFALLALAIVLAGCGPVDGDEIKKNDFWGGPGSSGVTGTVYDHHTTGKIHRLYIRDADGTEYRVRVRLGWSRQCDKDEHYPACAKKGG